MPVWQQKPGPSLRHSKELQICRCSSCDQGPLGTRTFSWKRAGLAEVGETGEVRAGQGEAAKRPGLVS